MPIQIHDDDNVLSEMLAEDADALFAVFCQQENIPPAAIVDVTLVDAQTIQTLNADYRDVDKVTDVLSFPQYDDMAELEADPVILLGDIVICLERVEEQAEAYGHSFKREFLYLLLHGLLHLIGYDHLNEADKKEMRAQEETILAQLGVQR